MSGAESVPGDAPKVAPRVAYVPAHLPSYEAEERGVFGRSRAELERLLGDHGAELRPVPRPVETRADAERVARELAAEGVDLVILQSGSFAMGDVVLPFADQGLRLCLWAPEEPERAGPIPLNGFVSMHLQAGVLRRYLGDRAGPFKWLFGGGEHPWFRDRLAVTLRALRALTTLERARIGLVGGIAPSFLNLAFDGRALRRRWGAEVVEIELGAVIDDAAGRDDAEVEEVAAQLAAAGRVEVTPEDLRANAAVYLALRRAAREHELTALAVSDWPRFQERLRLHPGAAFSWLDERDGVPVAAEGDVLGAASMLLGRAVSGAGAMLLDIVDVDPERDALLLWHCGGSPLALADERGVRWTPHTTLGRGGEGPPMGTVADLRFRRGPVTVLRLGADGGSSFALDAEVIDSPHPGFDGSRGWVSGFRSGGERFAVGDVVETVLGRGIEHHLALVPGHHAGALREATAWAGGRTEEIAPYRDELAPEPPRRKPHR